MTRLYCLFLFQLLFCYGNLLAQQDTTITKPDSVDSRLLSRDSIVTSATPIQPTKDSFSRKPEGIDSARKFDKTVPLIYQVISKHPFFGFSAKPKLPADADVKIFKGKELLFYALLALLLIFAFLRQAFSKYFTDLFRLFFRTTLKQRQIREQLMQTPLPSLLMNGFFIICGSLYISFLLIHFQFIEERDFWLFSFYSCLGLSAIYLVKFLGLKVTGWVFGIEEATNSYIFIVFIVNKVIGVFLLPILILLAFLNGQGYQIALVLSWLGVGGLFLYRFILSYSAVHNQVRFNLFHFFLYLCAFEIAPLLLIYKLLLVIFQ